MLNFLETLNRVFEAGIAISALSLFLRSLTLNLRDRVSRAFAVILACVMVGAAGEAISGSLELSDTLEFWLRFQWLGTIFMPAAFLHFSDAILETTGRPSRGRRRLAVRLSYLISVAFVVLLLSGELLGPPLLTREPVPHLTRTTYSWVFTGYYVAIILLAVSTIWRAFSRSVLSASRRRIAYIMVAALALGLGVYPYLMLGSGIAAALPELFFLTAAFGNLLVFWAMVVMAYATAFFGVSWPDRVVRSRLFRWMLRGPVTVFIVLALIPLVSPLSVLIDTQESVVLPILVALSGLLTAHALTLAVPMLERWFLFAGEGQDVELLQNLQERALTNADLRQFLEAVLAAVCDRLRTKTAFAASFEDGALRTVVQVGARNLLEKRQASAELRAVAESSHGGSQVLTWGKFWIVPLHSAQDGELIGLLGAAKPRKEALLEEQQRALLNLAERAGLALDNRRRQADALASLQNLGPRVDLTQRLRAASRFDQSEVLSEEAALPDQSDLVEWVKDALTHYWGGPKLVDSPLHSLQIVRSEVDEAGGNPAQALRSILKTAIERNKPQGQPRINGEWLLYNLLELKFLQGRKVREVAQRLAMSEPDLYRKQRVALESVARSLLEMEAQAIKAGGKGKSRGQRRNGKEG
jgi:hypothetical protein